MQSKVCILKDLKERNFAVPTKEFWRLFGPKRRMLDMGPAHQRGSLKKGSLISKKFKKKKQKGTQKRKKLSLEELRAFKLALIGTRFRKRSIKRSPIGVGNNSRRKQPASKNMKKNKNHIQRMSLSKSAKSFFKISNYLSTLLEFLPLQGAKDLTKKAYIFVRRNSRTKESMERRAKKKTRSPKIRP
jgi:hypothetical protein